MRNLNHSIFRNFFIFVSIPISFLNIDTRKIPRINNALKCSFQIYNKKSFIFNSIMFFFTLLQFPSSTNSKQNFQDIKFKKENNRLVHLNIYYLNSHSSILVFTVIFYIGHKAQILH